MRDVSQRKGAWVAVKRPKTFFLTSDSTGCMSELEKGIGSTSPRSAPNKPAVRPHVPAASVPSSWPSLAVVAISPPATRVVGS
jgi:hypothetical protein